ncbi:MAG: shikimate dehydrogenase [Rikenellaceae bacterium]
MSREYGLIGFKLGHSFSKRYFTDFFEKEGLSDCSYESYSFEDISTVREVVGHLQGFSVTIPHKRTIIPFLNSLSKEAAEMGAVNCVRVFANGDMRGYNTDCYGFEVALLDMLGEKRPNAFVLGTGGASKAVCYTLKKLGISFQEVSRNSSNGVLTYEQLTPLMMADALVVNTTPLGMFPIVDGAPKIPYEGLTPKSYLFDLVYNPADTLFTRNGRRQGATVKSGYQMLVEQAQKAWQIYNE